LRRFVKVFEHIPQVVEFPNFFQVIPVGNPGVKTIKGFPERAQNGFLLFELFSTFFCFSQISVRSANRIFILFVSAIKLTPSRKEVRGDGEAAEWRA
jgi:hypothetical protein